MRRTPTTICGHAVDDSEPIPGDALGRHTVDVILRDRPALETPGRILDPEALDAVETNLAAGEWPHTMAAARQLCRDLVATIHDRPQQPPALPGDPPQGDPRP